jgi:DNA-binding transcriptional LysR family regulator
MNLMVYAKTFLAVYRLGSVTSAAAQLALTQPGASGHLKALETALQKKLFYRVGRGLEPTASAHALAQSLGPYIDGLEQVLTVNRMSNDELVGVITLGGPVEFLSRLLLPCIAQITDSRLQISVVFGLAADLAEALRRTELDLAVLTVKPPQASMDSVALYREDFALVVAPAMAARLSASRLAAGDTAELEALPWLAYDDTLPMLRRFWRKEFGRLPGLRLGATVPDLRALRMLCLANAGATVLPRYLIESDLEEGLLVEPVRARQTPGNTLYLSWVKGSLRSPRIMHMRDRIVAAAEQL